MKLNPQIKALLATIGILICFVSFVVLCCYYKNLISYIIIIMFFISLFALMCVAYLGLLDFFKRKP